MDVKKLAGLLAEWSGGTVGQREQELKDLLWAAASDSGFRKKVERAMKDAAREYSQSMGHR